MLTKTITYEDFDGETRTETFYFNLSKAELAERQITYPGGYAEYLDKIIESKDKTEIFKAFKDLILSSYGEKSEDGKRFIKSKELSEAFEQTGAYDELFMELFGDGNEAAAFVRGIMPFKDLPETTQDELMDKTRKLIEEKKNA